MIPRLWRSVRSARPLRPSAPRQRLRARRKRPSRSAFKKRLPRSRPRGSPAKPKKPSRRRPKPRPIKRPSETPATPPVRRSASNVRKSNARKSRSIEFGLKQYSGGGLRDRPRIFGARLPVASASSTMEDQCFFIIPSSFFIPSFDIVSFFMPSSLDMVSFFMPSLDIVSFFIMPSSLPILSWGKGGRRQREAERENGRRNAERDAGTNGHDWSSLRGDVCQRRTPLSDLDGLPRGVVTRPLINFRGTCRCPSMDAGNQKCATQHGRHLPRHSVSNYQMREHCPKDRLGWASARSQRPNQNHGKQGHPNNRPKNRRRSRPRESRHAYAPPPDCVRRRRSRHSPFRHRHRACRDHAEDLASIPRRPRR